MSTTMVRKEDVVRKWYVLDAAGKPLGKTAALAADLLRGKRKVDYTPHVDCGDFVIIINAKEAVLTGNKLTYANMIDNIDVDASPLIYGTKTIEELGQELLKLTQEVACGKQTKAESLGFTEMAIARVCNYV